MLCEMSEQGLHDGAVAGGYSPFLFWWSFGENQPEELYAAEWASYIHLRLSQFQSGHMV
jgi:hypothetical protein